MVSLQKFLDSGKSFVKTYLSYIFYLFSKKILLFGIVVYLTESFNENSIIMFVLFCFSYLSVYFGNDLIDRVYDKNRKYILDYKLVLSAKVLKYLFLIHLLLPFSLLLIFNLRVAIASFLISVCGILRSYIRNQTVRELTLFFLQAAQFYLMFMIVNCVNMFTEKIFVILSFSLLYTINYYLHKIPEKGESLLKTLTYFIMCGVLSLLSLYQSKDILTLLYSMLATPSVVISRKLYVCSKEMKFKQITTIFHLIAFLGGISLIILVASNLKMIFFL